MGKVLVITAVVLLLALGIGYMMRDYLKESPLAGIDDAMFIPADTDNFDPGPTLGSTFPGVRATFGDKAITMLTPFAGTNGTVFIASRSLDWCPYCMKQMIQLQQHRDEFEAAGIGMVAMTYDAPELQQKFIDKFSITIPILSDVDAMTFKTLGILNAEHAPGDAHYGIPYPGMIVIDPQGIIVGKLFVEAYSSRVDSAAALDYANAALARQH